MAETAGVVALVAVTVKVEVPGVVGVPEITPVVPFSASPAGSVPSVIPNVGDGIPLAVTPNEYGVPAVPAGGAPDEIAGLLAVVGVPPAAQFDGTVIEFDCSVTAAVLASSRPITVAPVATVMDFAARTVPWNCALVPMLAELPTCQKTLQALAPPVMMMCVADPMVRLLAAWNTQMESAAVPASVRVPLFERPSAPPE
jgi:hypothetical protein